MCSPERSYPAAVHADRGQAVHCGTIALSNRICLRLSADLACVRFCTPWAPAPSPARLTRVATSTRSPSLVSSSSAAVLFVHSSVPVALPAGELCPAGWGGESCNLPLVDLTAGVPTLGVTLKASSQVNPVSLADAKADPCVLFPIMRGADAVPAALPAPRSREQPHAAFDSARHLPRSRQPAQVCRHCAHHRVLMVWML